MAVKPPHSSFAASCLSLTYWFKNQPMAKFLSPTLSKAQCLFGSGASALAARQDESS